MIFSSPFNYYVCYYDYDYYYLHVYVYIFLFLGYTNNFYRKGDEILVFHSHEVPSMPSAPYPCKLKLLLF